MINLHFSENISSSGDNLTQIANQTFEYPPSVRCDEIYADKTLHTVHTQWKSKVPSSSQKFIRFSDKIYCVWSAIYYALVLSLSPVLGHMSNVLESCTSIRGLPWIAITKSRCIPKDNQVFSSVSKIWTQKKESNNIHMQKYSMYLYENCSTDTHTPTYTYREREHCTKCKFYLIELCINLHICMSYLPHFHLQIKCVKCCTWDMKMIAYAHI